MMFEVGQQVKCVKDDGVTRLRGIVNGGVYTIAKDDGKFVDLVEIDPQGGWYRWRFRPATKLTAFKKILDEVTRQDSRAVVEVVGGQTVPTRRPGA